MLAIHDIPFNLLKIKRRAMAFWGTGSGIIIVAAALFSLNQIDAAKVVAFAGVILTIATWMSAMMSLCPVCRANFHEGYAPRVWPRFACAHCNLDMSSGNQSPPPHNIESAN